MKRDPALRLLSEHHHHALVHSLAIRRAREGSADAAAWRRIADDVLRFWEASGRAHFDDEERILFPAYLRWRGIESDPEVDRLFQDHAWVRDAMARLAEAVAKDRTDSELLVELGIRLAEHVRFEEDVVFPKIESALSREVLDEVGGRLRRLHPHRA